MDDQILNDSDQVKNQNVHPSPSNLEEFLRWACAQLQFYFTPVIKLCGTHNLSAQSTSTKGRKGQRNKEDDLDADSDIGGNTLMSSIKLSDSNLRGIVFIYTVYDCNKNLTEIKFLKNFNVPNVLLKLISLAVPFHPRLTAIYIDRGLDQSALYELWKILTLSTVTEVTLDGTELIQANYYILLDENSPLRYLSLARCKINDVVVEKIALRLVCTLSASQNLCALNLTSNRITDVGAKYLGDALKVNRKLSYLNLSGNMITDIGAGRILDSLQEFPITSEELKDMKSKHIIYLKNKDRLIQKVIDEMRVSELDKKIVKKKSQKPTIAASSRKCKTLERTSQISVPTIDEAWYAKAETIAEASIGTFTHAFKSDNTFTKEGILYCFGNNYLSCLNLAYNNLTYISIKKIYDVLYKQAQLNRKPKGLIQIRIDGNNMPQSCFELSEIERIIGSSTCTSQKASGTKKKATGKMSAKLGTPTF